MLRLAPKYQHKPTVTFLHKILVIYATFNHDFHNDYYELIEQFEKC